MKILALIPEVLPGSWLDNLLGELAFLGAEVSVITSDCPNNRLRLSYHNLSQPPQHFSDDIASNMALFEDVDILLTYGADNFERACTFHQALGCKHILLEPGVHCCDNKSFHDLRYGWEKIIQCCDSVIVLSASTLQLAEEVKVKSSNFQGCIAEEVKVKSLNFWGCIADVEEYCLMHYQRSEAAIGVYQGTLDLNLKTECFFIDDVHRFIDQGYCKKFVIISDSKFSQFPIIKDLQKLGSDKFNFLSVSNRNDNLKVLRDAFFAYDPTSGPTISEFAIDCFGCRLPVIMPYAEDHYLPLFVKSYNAQLREVLADIYQYGRLTIAGKAYYDLNHSVEIMGQTYIDHFEEVLNKH